MMSLPLTQLVGAKSVFADFTLEDVNALFATGYTRATLVAASFAASVKCYPNFVAHLAQTEIDAELTASSFKNFNTLEKRKTTMNTTTAPLALKTGHIGLNVTDLKRSISFYQEVFGFNLLSEGTHKDQPFAFLGDNETLFVTLWQQSAGEFPKALPGLHHLSFAVENLDTLKAVENRLRGLDTSFAYDGIVPHAEGGQAGAIFFYDPDGIRLEIYAPSGGEGKSAPVAGAPSCGFF